MNRVDGVVLAAGPSQRFRQAASAAGQGLPRIKQLLRFGDESLVRRAARAALASRLGHVLVVIGCEAAAVRAEVDDLGVEVVYNPHFEDGQSTSVRAALEHVEAEAAMFIPCDQPLLRTETLDRLLAAWEETGAGIVVPTANGARRAPVLFARPLFEALGQITGDSGGRQLFAAYPDSILEVEVDHGQALRDLDTPQDYRELLLSLNGTNSGSQRD